jgi:RNA polymerase sigma factor (sigma-70 family)
MMMKKKKVQIEDTSFVSPERSTDSQIKGEIIQKALLKVKPVYREVVILRDIEGLSYEEIAEITELSIGTVKSRINRGRKHLQELLKNIYSG